MAEASSAQLQDGLAPGDHTLPTAEPIGPVHVISGRGFVFDATVARRLRDEHHIVGAAVGALSGFRQQDSVHGLPIELLPEELTFAVQRGWLSYAGDFPPDPLPEAAIGAGGKPGAAGSKPKYNKPPVRWAVGPPKKQQAAPKGAGADLPYLALAKTSGRITVPLTHPWRPDAPPSAAELAGRLCEAGSRSAGGATSSDRGDAAAAVGTAAAAAAQAGGAYAASSPEGKRRRLDAEAPDLSGGAGPADLRPGTQATGQAVTAASSSAASQATSRIPGWTFPATRAERIRMSVFADLSKRGYFLSTGAKFGSDFLAYPGDPAMYHAQFTVRCLDQDEPIHPLSLGAVARMAHTARKNVLLASAVPLGARGGGAAGLWAEAEYLPGEAVGYITARPDITQSSQRTNR